MRVANTPSSVLPEWACGSPKVTIEAVQEKAPEDSKLTVEIPNSDGHSETAAEQRDAAPEEAPQEKADSINSDSPTKAKFECDYDTDPTDIFLNLQRKEWDETSQRSADFPDEARTWVSRKEKHGKLRWRLLPIHAAIIFKAPDNVIESLLAAYPKGAQSKDDQGMLPLHLAFRHGSSEGTVNLLLAAFPQSVGVQDRKGRIPLVLAQASASANREAFVRALERGPTYYANAAAATERAAVTAEQRAIFDSKLIEVEKKHQQDINQLKEERNNLTETVEILQNELSKQKASTQILIDHVNSLEALLSSKGDTERFLAVKAATLDTNLKEMVEQKEKAQKKLEDEMTQLREENVSLKKQVEEGIQADSNIAEVNACREKLAKQEKEMKSVRMDWASAQARSAVLEAQLKSKIENEHELASQVSQLAGKLAESAAYTGSASSLYSKRVQALEEEREKLKATVNDLGKKLVKVSEFMNKMTQKTHETTKKSNEDAKKKQLQLLAEAADQEKLIRTALEERKSMAAMLKQQEMEMEKSAQQHQEILQRLAALKNRAPTPPPGDGSDIPFSSSLSDEMKELLNSMPKQVNSDEFYDSYVSNVNITKSKCDAEEKKGAGNETYHVPEYEYLPKYSSSSEDDAQKCLEEALNALQSQNKKEPSPKVNDTSTKMTDEAPITSAPSDEEVDAPDEDEAIAEKSQPEEISSSENSD